MKDIIDDPDFLQVRPIRPVYLDPLSLRPLAQALCGISCSMCDKRQSVWELPSARRGEPVCSLCWLYESEWGKEHREDIETLVRAVEVYKGEMFKKTDDGRLLDCRDADHVLGSIAVTSRIARQRAMLASLGGDDEP